jgi:prenyltransferase beta subunit
MGGFSKYPGELFGDPVHTLHSIYGLNLLGYPTTKDQINYT